MYWKEQKLICYLATKTCSQKLLSICHDGHQIIHWFSLVPGLRFIKFSFASPILGLKAKNSGELVVEYLAIHIVISYFYIRCLHINVFDNLRCLHIHVLGNLRCLHLKFLYFHVREHNVSYTIGILTIVEQPLHLAHNLLGFMHHTVLEQGQSILKRYKTRSVQLSFSLLLCREIPPLNVTSSLVLEHVHVPGEDWWLANYSFFLSHQKFS